MDEFAEINITPFTDVLLVLLIIFIMMAALIVPAGFEKQFKPSTPGRHAAATLPTADLIIARSGAMTLDGRRVDERTIYPALTALHALHKNVSLAIYGDNEAPYRYVIRAMDAAKAASIDNVSFVTK